MNIRAYLHVFLREVHLLKRISAKYLFSLCLDKALLSKIDFMIFSYLSVNSPITKIIEDNKFESIHYIILYFIII